MWFVSSSDSEWKIKYIENGTFERNTRIQNKAKRLTSKFLTTSVLVILTVRVWFCGITAVYKLLVYHNDFSLFIEYIWENIKSCIEVFFWKLFYWCFDFIFNDHWIQKQPVEYKFGESDTKKKQFLNILVCCQITHSLNFHEVGEYLERI